MKYLLDTHYLIWTISESGRLPRKIKDLITDSGNQIFASAISFWEISLKTSIGKLHIEGFTPDDIPGLCEKMHFAILPLSAQESTTFHLLKNYHKDPFAGMLVWQAIQKGYTLMTGDAAIIRYVSEGLKVATP